MKIGSLFSGIGGLELGLARATGGHVIWQAEKDPYARKVLAKHWPGVRCYEDVKEIDETAERPEIICGGFPCQDISIAGKGAGLDGERSGLWWEFHRIVRALGPRYVFVENVAALANRGLTTVLGAMAELGFDAEWDVFQAAQVGAHHLRARVFILFAHPVLKGLEGHGGKRRLGQGQGEVEVGRPCPWAIEPNVGRVAHGVPHRSHRLRCLGNAVVPQVAEVAWHTLMGRWNDG